MKKYILSLVLFTSLCISALYVVSCQKEFTQENNDEISIQPLNEAAGVVDRVPVPTGTVTTLCSCSERQCNTIGPPSNFQFNGIKVVLNANTHQFFNSMAGNGLTYTIRQGNNCSGPVIASFQCRNQTVYFESALLQNSTTYSLKISYGIAESQCYTFTTSNCREMPCNNNQ